MNISKEAKDIATSLKLADQITVTAEKHAYIILKDHKANFETTPSCRLINPSKPELGKISKHILYNINSVIASRLSLNQWKNTQAVINWFNNIIDKNNYTFIEFDIVNFYPSITVKLLNAALNFASSYVNISDSDRNIIMHTKKSLLYNTNGVWSKPSSDKLFNITMGSYDGTETCELVGSFILHLITATMATTSDFTETMALE